MLLDEAAWRQTAQGYEQFLGKIEISNQSRFRDGRERTPDCCRSEQIFRFDQKK
jgi:hypothetical protein